MVTRPHAWKLVAPWWRWTRAAHPADGRETAPVLQKLAGDDFVEQFLADPQRSIVFDPRVDVVASLDARAIASSLKGLAQAPLRKLFLPAHDRHNLVVCELHCDLPGLPSVDRAQVCQAGFVVRRRTTAIPKALEDKAEELAALLAVAESESRELEALAEEPEPVQAHIDGDVARRQHEAHERAERREALRREAGASSWQAYLAGTRKALDTTRGQVGRWFAERKLAEAIQGWVPAKGWVTLTPEQRLSDSIHALGEHYFPLTPLIADPRKPRHDASGRTLYFGVVPTVLADHDALRRPRLDSTSTYEIRCFVRRHDPGLPRRAPGAPDCCGQVTWSRPTEPYRVAPPFDLVGTAQRPITIQMPDLNELAAQVRKRPRRRLSPVAFVQPQHLSPKLSGMLPTGGAPGGAAMCFFAIPLITIVALFLLNIFLPIVVVLFNLWYLLALTFCIKPQVSVAGGLDAALTALPPSANLRADGAVTVDGNTLDAGELKDALVDRVRDGMGEQIGPDKPSKAKLASSSVEDLAGLAQAQADNAALPDELPADAPRPGAEPLEYVPRREPQWSLASVGGA